MTKQEYLAMSSEGKLKPLIINGADTVVLQIVEKLFKFSPINVQ